MNGISDFLSQRVSALCLSESSSLVMVFVYLTGVIASDEVRGGPDLPLDEELLALTFNYLVLECRCRSRNAFGTTNFVW